MPSFFNIPPDISKADKPREFEGGTLISRQAANLSSKRASEKKSVKRQQTVIK